MMNRRQLWPTTILAVALALGCSNATGNGDDTTPARPALISVDPGFGVVGTEITVVGEHFGDTQGGSEVRVGAGAAIVSSWSDTQILASVGTHSYPGAREVQVEGAGGIGGGLEFDVQLSPTLYVNDDQPINTVSAYGIDPATGEITALAGSPYATGSLGPEFPGDVHLVAIHEGTRRLFVTNDDSVAVFDIHPTTGALTAVSGSPFATTAVNTFGLAVTPDGHTLYAAAFNIDSVIIMDIAADGTLSEHAASPAMAANQVDLPLVTADGSFLYVNAESGDFAAFGINGDGSLTALTGSPYEVDADGFAKGAVLSGAGDYLYIGDVGLDVIYSYILDGASGIPESTAHGPHASTMPDGMAFTPDGSRLFTSSAAGTTVDCFTVLSGGDLSMATQIDLSDDGVNGISGIGFTASGDYMYVIDEIGGDVNAYSVSAGCTASTLTRAITPVTNAASPFAPGGRGMSGPLITRF